MPTNAVYERARLSRDPRFDGRFFVGVRTTGIYCRPVCPANPPKSENVSFYPTAAAASEAGFRPCLRCRPECAPGTPAWAGTSTTVRRGLKLIASGALDDGNIEQLAERLGVTSRHLRRLFSRHLGASPLSVAHTQRLHFAKRLIDQTQLPLADIAVAAGYGSVRRFNDTFKKTYGRSPRELRKRSDRAVTGSSLSVRLPYRPPYDWDALLDFFAGRAIPGVESVSDGVYRRSVSIDGRHGVLEVANDAAADSIVVSVSGVETASLFQVVQTAREMFDVDAPIADIHATLRKDPVLKSALKRRPGIRVPGTWDPFELSVRAILGQQVSVKAATTLSGRIVDRYGEPLDLESAAAYGITHLFPTPKRLGRARLNKMGLVGARAETISRLARAVSRRDIDFDDDADTFVEAMTALRGIGDWTAQYVLMRAHKNPDAFPASDLGLLRAFDRPGTKRLTPRRLTELSERWRPWRAYAALLLWSSPENSGG
ncbi:MAG: AlkA N-terminal domain-containing protein [Woeseiaceae bacterium]|nr:AlkA N-terminal domain-containing protein [Woeseiaceae bacterium]